MPNRKFTVQHLAVDAFPTGHTFDEAEYRRLHPAPANAKDKDAHVEAELARLISLGAVIEVPESTPADETPLGPQNPAEVPKLVTSKEDVLSASGGQSEPEPRRGPGRPPKSDSL